MANNDLVNSLLKGLDILHLVGGNADGMRVSEIAETLGWKVPATHNLVRTLLARGFLEKRNGNILYVGPELLDIASRQRDGSLTAAAEQELQQLHELMPAGVVVFGGATAQEMRQVFRISSERPRVLQRLSGDVFHPYASASGLAGLAFAEEPARMQMEERHPFAEFGAHLWQNRAVLETYLAEVRKGKTAVSPFDSEMFFRVAVPVLDVAKRLIGVVGASIPMANLNKLQTQEYIIRHLKSAAVRLGSRGRSSQ